MRRAVVVALLLLAACGGDDKSAKDEWLDTARAACDERFATIDVAGAQLTPESTAQQQATWLAQFVVPAYRAQLDKLRAANPPDDTARALIDDTATLIDAIAADPLRFATPEDPFVAIDARWDAYGLEECGTRD